jgi:hypothetical protein
MKVRKQGHQDDTNEEYSEASDQGDANDSLWTLRPEHEKRPDEVELLFDLKRPEVVDVEVGKDECVIVPDREIRGVGEVEVLPARPDEMKRPCQQKQDYQDAIVEREDAECAAEIEVFEKVRSMERVQKDAGDEKAGEDEEEVDPNIRGHQDAVHQVEKKGACFRVRYEEMTGEDEKNSQATYSVKSRDVGKSAWVLSVA